MLLMGVRVGRRCHSRPTHALATGCCSFHVRSCALPRRLSLTRAILRLGETAGSRACSAEIPPLRPASDASEPPIPPQTQNRPPSVTLTGRAGNFHSRLVCWVTCGP